MVNGPVALQHQIIKPPLFSNNLQVYTKTYPDHVGPSCGGVPSKFHQQPHFHPHQQQMGYGKQHYIDTGLVKTSKYPELFMTPLDSPLPGYGYGGGVEVYPVDVETAIPTATAPKLDDSLEQRSGPGANNTDMDSVILGKSDVDLNSLLSMLAPDNKLNDVPSEGYAIPNLDFLSESSPQQAKGVTTSSSPAVQPFDVPVLDNSNSKTEEQIFWEGTKKESLSPELTFNPMMTTDSNLPLSFNMASPVDDPFMTELLRDEPILAFPPDDSRYSQAATPTSDIFHAGLAEDHSPLPVSGQSSPTTPGQTGNIAPSSWDSNLQDLFEKTVDLSDMIDFMLPPPSKVRRSESDLSLNDKNWIKEDPELLLREVKVEPTSPLAQSPSIASPVEVDATSEKGGGAGKGKSTILFGQHEDEILHKLLSPRPGTHAKPVSRDKLVSMPVEEFNHLLEQASLSEIEVAFMKEWRRRGKNKAAAQIARKRKREEVGDLETEVKGLRKQKAELNKKYDRLRSQIAALKKRSMSAEDRVYRQQTKLTGETVSRDTHLIHLTDDDKLLLVPRISSQVLTISK